MTVGLLLVIICLLAALWPEVSFALFFCAGAFKADPRLSALAELIDQTLLLFSVTLAGILIQIIRKQLVVTVPKLQLLVPYYIFVFMMIAGLLYTPAPIYGMGKTIRFILLTSFVLFVPGVIFSRQKAISRFLITFVSFALIFTFLSIISNIGESSLMYVSGLEGSSYLALGRIAGTGILICLFFYVVPTSNWFVTILGTSACLLMLTGVLFAGGRGPLLALLLSVISTTLFILIHLRTSAVAHQIKQKLLLINGLMIIGGAGLLYRYADKFERIFYRLEILISSSGGESASARMAMITSAIEASLSFPTILLGLGIGGFSAHYAQFDDTRGIFPHNILLETAVELGLFALIAIIVLLYFSIKTICRMQENNYIYKMLFFSLIVFAFINAMISGDFNDNRLLFFCIGLILGLKRLEMT